METKAKKLTQEERLDYLVEEFKADSAEYKELQTPNSTEDIGPIVQYKLTPKLEKDLENCYRNTLDMCAENGLKSVAFCCISTGVFLFPNKKAAEIAVKTVSEWLRDNPGKVERVIFNVFKDEDKAIYEKLI